MRRGGVGLLRVVERQFQRLVDQLPARDVVPVDQGDGGAGGAGPAGAADPVQVGLLVLGALVVDDVGDALDVDAAGCDVGADQHVDLAVAEGPQGLLAGALAEVAVDGAGREAALGQLVGDVGGGALGAAEDHRQPAAVGLQDARDHLDLVERVRTEDVLLDVGDGRAGVVRGGGPDVGRLAHVPAGEADHLARHGGREQQGLPLGRQHGDDLLDVGQEAQVEHLVGLVQDQRAHLGQVQLLLPGQVEQTARGADHDVDALGERLDLRPVRPAAVDGEDTHVADLAGGLQVVGDLRAELAGRDDDQRLRELGELLLGGPAGVHVGAHGDPLDQREAEAEGLAGAGLGLADDVVAGQRDREGHLLDGEGVDDADGFEGLGGLREDPQVPEGRLDGFSGGGQGAASSVWRGRERAAGGQPRGCVRACAAPIQLRGRTTAPVPAAGRCALPGAGRVAGGVGEDSREGPARDLRQGAGSRRPSLGH